MGERGQEGARDERSSQRERQQERPLPIGNATHDAGRTAIDRLLHGDLTEGAAPSLMAQGPRLDQMRLRVLARRRALTQMPAQLHGAAAQHDAERAQAFQAGSGLDGTDAITVRAFQLELGLPPTGVVGDAELACVQDWHREVEPDPALGGGGYPDSYVPHPGDTPFVDGIKPDDFLQIGWGDSYLVASMIAIARQHPELLQRAIRKACDGSYEVELNSFRGYGANERRTREQVVISNLFPAMGGDVKTGGVVPKDPREAWGPMIEKAYAVISGGEGRKPSGPDDEALRQGASPAWALKVLTGRNAQRMDVGSGASDFLMAAEANRWPVVLTTRLNPKNGKEEVHHWALDGFRDRVGKRYFVLRDPRTEWCAQVEEHDLPTYISEIAWLPI